MNFLKFMAKYYLYGICFVISAWVGFNIPYWMGVSNTHMVIQIISN